MVTLAPPRRPDLPLAIVGALAVVVLVFPLPGSLSVVVTKWLSTVGGNVSNVDIISEAGLLVLAVGTTVALLISWRRHPERRTHAGVAAIGVIVAYAASEGAKVLFAQERPCARWQTVGECPPPGDWSLPSNHATLAFGAVVVIALATRRAWATWVTVVIAVLVAGGRVAQGVHYLHDIALGALFGILIPTALVLVTAAWVKRGRRGRRSILRAARRRAPREGVRRPR